MNVRDRVKCEKFPCIDVNHDGYIIPGIDINPEKVRLLMISEAAPPDPADYYYADGNPSYEQTTVMAFNDAGVDVSSMEDILELGVYLTTAVKCSKTVYGIKAPTIKECSHLLEKEVVMFPNLKAILLMGDVAIKGINYIAKRLGEPRVIPAGSTYKIRGQEYSFKGVPAFPSYLQVGPSFNIEKSKRRMIAEDIVSAVSLIQ
jgi:uracil-DNA glycosylase